MRNARGNRVMVLSLAATFLFGIGAASAEKSSKSKAKEPVPEPVVKKKLDPLEAALAKAVANSEAPIKKAKKTKLSKAQKRARKIGGLKGLRKFASSANKAKIGVKSHSKRIPGHEQVVRMSTQPLAAAAITKVIKRNTGNLQYCHERLAVHGNAPNGEVSVRFVVHNKGHTTKIKVSAGGGAKARDLERCIVQHIRGWKFPTADAPTNVEYPFVFDIAGSSVDSPSKN